MLKGNGCQGREERKLGIDRSITRRDFLNATLLGVGAALLNAPAPGDRLQKKDSWDGYGGVGDYANSAGNTGDVVRVAHEIRDGRYDRPPADAINIEEIYDLVVVGGGLSGLGAAYQFKKTKQKSQKCLILENHPIFGGESKRNEFIVEGQRLIGPQGANDFAVPSGTGSIVDVYFAELNIPRQFHYQSWDSGLKPLRFSLDNYGSMFWAEERASVGYFFDQKSHGVQPRWIPDPWSHELEGMPVPARVKRDFLRWMSETRKPYQKKDFQQWLDTMTYKDYLEKIMRLSPRVTEYADPLLASAIGLGCDALSAYAAFQVAMPGVRAFLGRFSFPTLHSFPGGNDGLARHFIKALFPQAINGGQAFADILNRQVNFKALDHPENDIRMRVGSTVVRVEHAGSPLKSEHVWVTYVKDGKAFRLKARAVVMASGGWINRYVVRDLASDYKQAYQQFHHSPMLVVNVALTNWRFLYNLGVTACRWFGGFGFSCNIRQPMMVGRYRPPLHPDKPTILTFYVPFYYPGRPVSRQGAMGRGELLSTSFFEYERQIREHLIRVFGQAGFNPKTDIAGIILNRWGHAYVNPQPGFYFGREGKGAPRDVIRKRFGRIAFGHSELLGHQNWVGAVTEGRRAMEQVQGILG